MKYLAGCRVQRYAELALLCAEDPEFLRTDQDWTALMARAKEAATTAGLRCGTCFIDPALRDMVRSSRGGALPGCASGLRDRLPRPMAGNSMGSYSHDSELAEPIFSAADGHLSEHAAWREYLVSRPCEGRASPLARTGAS